jgi:hypothetical protein
MSPIRNIERQFSYFSSRFLNEATISFHIDFL